MDNWLADLTVLEIGRTPAAMYCGRLMAQLGATVICPDPAVHPQVPAHVHKYLRHGKQSLASAGALQECLRGRRADILIGDADSDFAGYAELAQPTAARGIVDAFGPSGPWAHWKGSELVFSSIGGAAGYTLSEDGVPVYGIGHRYQYLTGMYLYTALMALLHRCDGEPTLPASEREVRVSTYEAVVSLMPYLPVQYFYNGSNRVDNHTGPRFVVRCQDGWLMAYLGPVWRAAAGLLERADLLDDPRFQSTAAQFENVAALAGLVREWGADKTVAKAMAAARKWDIAVTEILSVPTVLAQTGDGHCGEWERIGGGLAPKFPVVMKSAGVH